MDTVRAVNTTAGEYATDPSPRGAKRRVQQRSKTTREKLIAAARLVFAEKGYLATEVSDIVSRVPITKGALYHHFGGKEKLFEEACSQIALELHEASSDVVRPYSGDAWKQLTVSIEARLGLIVSNAEAQKILLIDGPSVLGWKRWRAIQARISLTPLQQTLDILIEQGTIAPQSTRTIAQLLLAALNDAALSVAESAEPRNESMDQLRALSIFISGLRNARL